MEGKLLGREPCTPLSTPKSYTVAISQGIRLTICYIFEDNRNLLASTCSCSIRSKIPHHKVQYMSHSVESGYAEECFEFDVAERDDTVKNDETNHDRLTEEEIAYRIAEAQGFKRKCICAAWIVSLIWNNIMDTLFVGSMIDVVCPGRKDILSEIPWPVFPSPEAVPKQVELPESYHQLVTTLHSHIKESPVGTIVREKLSVITSWSLLAPPQPI